MVDIVPGPEASVLTWAGVAFVAGIARAPPEKHCEERKLQLERIGECSKTLVTPG